MLDAVTSDVIKVQQLSKFPKQSSARSDTWSTAYLTKYSDFHIMLPSMSTDTTCALKRASQPV